MDTVRLRSAAGDASRSAQSILRSSAANPERLTEELAGVIHGPELTPGPDDTPYGLRAAAREHMLWAVAFMDAARELEQTKGGAA